VVFAPGFTGLHSGALNWATWLGANPWVAAGDANEPFFFCVVDHPAYGSRSAELASRRAHRSSLPGLVESIRQRSPSCSTVVAHAELTWLLPACGLTAGGCPVSRRVQGDSDLGGVPSYPVLLARPTSFL